MLHRPIQPREPGREPRRHVPLWLQSVRYLAAYLLGIALAIALTPVEIALAGRTLWHLYPLLAIPGVFALYLGLPPGYAPTSAPGDWIFVAVGLLPIIGWAMSCLRFGRPLRDWHALWVGAPLGFVGTVGVYYTAAASI